MSEERRVPEELARYDAELGDVERRAQRRAELGDVERRAQRRVDPGVAAAAVAVAVLVLVGGLMLPWTGGSAGWEVLAGTAPVGPLPRFFAGLALGFGALGSMVALASRSWAVAWVCAVGCGFSVVAGVWAIWSRQIGVPDGGTGPGIGLVLAVLAVLALAVTWVRIALRN